MAYTQNILSNDEVLNYLGIDYADDAVASNVAIMKQAAADFLNSAVGIQGDDDDARAKMLALAVVADMYDNRAFTDYSNKSSATVRKLVYDFSQQLILDKRGDSL